MHQKVPSDEKPFGCDFCTIALNGNYACNNTGEPTTSRINESPKFTNYQLINPLSSEGKFCDQVNSVGHVHRCIELVLLIIKMSTDNSSLKSVVLEFSVELTPGWHFGSQGLV